MHKQCLMIRTKDNRKFFTYTKNLPQLAEFSRTFNAEIAIVKTNADILDLNQLVPAICSNSYKNKSEYEVVEVAKSEPLKSKRKSQIKTAEEIQNFIKKELLEGHVIFTKDIKNKYKIHISTASNHIRKAIKGLPVLKEKQGKYKLA